MGQRFAHAVRDDLTQIKSYSAFMKQATLYQPCRPNHVTMTWPVVSWNCFFAVASVVIKRRGQPTEALALAATDGLVPECCGGLSVFRLLVTFLDAGCPEKIAYDT